MLLDSAVFQGRAAMGAMQVQHTDRAAFVAKHHQILAQSPNSKRCGADLAFVGHRMPEPAQILAPGRPPSRLGNVDIGMTVYLGTISRVSQIIFTIGFHFSSLELIGIRRHFRTLAGRKHSLLPDQDPLGHFFIQSESKTWK